METALAVVVALVAGVFEIWLIVSIWRRGFFATWRLLKEPIATVMERLTNGPQPDRTYVLADDVRVPIEQVVQDAERRA